MRLCEQNSAWVFCSKPSKHIMLVVAGQAAMHVPLHDLALMLQATAPAPLAGEDLRGRARGGISAVQHDLSAPPEGMAQLLRCIKSGLPCGLLSPLGPGKMLSNVHSGECREPPQAAFGAQQACTPARVIKAHNHRRVGPLSGQRLHCNHMLPGMRVSSSVYPHTGLHQASASGPSLAIA